MSFLEETAQAEMKRELTGTVKSSPMTDAIRRLRNLVGEDKELTSILRDRLSSIMDLSPRPEQEEAKAMRDLPATENIVGILHEIADRLSNTISEKREILDRIQL